MNGVLLPAGPYKGLAPFDDSELDAALFFGRDRDGEIIVANLLAARLTVLYGPSGVGKSSLLHARVGRRLQQEPGAELIVASSWPSDATGPLRAAGGAAAAGREVYVILDQFEEYFLYHAAAAGEDSLPAMLGELLSGEPRVHVLISVREDAVARLDAFKAWVPGILGNCLRLAQLDRAAGRAAITGPLGRWGELTQGAERVGIEEELVEAVIEGAATGGLALSSRDGGGTNGLSALEAPILQLVMERIWESERERRSPTLRLQTFVALGGAGAIVRDHLERALARLDSSQKDLVATMFDHLVTPSGSKIALRASDLAGYAGLEADELRPVLGTLCRERILRSVEATGGEGTERYEIFHDVLANAVLGWRAERRLERERQSAQRRHRRLLAVALASLAALAAVTGLAVYALVERNSERAHARQAAAREYEASALLGLSSGAADSLAFALRAARLEPDARAEAVLRQTLIESRLRRTLPTAGPVRALEFGSGGRRLLVAGGGPRLLLYDPATSRLVESFLDPATVTVAAFAPGGLLVSGDADGRVNVRDVATGQITQALHVRGAVTSVAFDRAGRLLLVTSAGGAASVWRIGGGLVRHLPEPGPVSLGVVDPAGDRVVTVATEAEGHSMARLFDLATGSLVRILPQRGVQDAAFNPAGSLIATASHSGAVDLWSAVSGRRLRELFDGGQNVLALSFSPDGSLLATANGDGATRVWNVSDGTRLFMFDGHTGPVVAVAWSADGRLLADGSADRTAWLFLVQGEPLVISKVATLPGNRGGTSTLAFAPDGVSIATGGADGGVRLWDSSPEERLVPLGFQRGPVWAATYSPSGRLVVSAGEDGTARIWDVRHRTLLHTLRVGRPVVDARFSPDGSLVLTASTDGTARIWRAASGSLVRELAGSSPLRIARFSPDGSLVVTGAEDGSVRIWRTSDGRQLDRLHVRGPVADAAFSPDGTLLATGSSQGAALWAVPAGKLLHKLPVAGGVLRLAFSPNGGLLATADLRSTATLWTVPNGRLLHTLRRHGPATSVTDVVFSPDGRLLLTTGSDSDGRTWAIPSGAPLALLRGQFGTLTAGAFSPDGRWIATAGPISSVLWAAAGDLLFYLRGHTAQLTTVSFAPLGEQILTASKDGSIRTYDCQVCGDLTSLEAIAAARLARSGIRP
jgi:WD40 repeat protein